MNHFNQAQKRKANERREQIRKLLRAGRTMVEIGSLLGITKQRVSQIIKEAK